MFRLGVDIGATKVNIGLLNDEGVLICRRKMLIPHDSGCRSLLKRIADTAKELLASAAVSPKQVASVGIGVPGTADGNRVIHAPNLGWKNEPCADLFQELFGLRPRLVQDTRAAAWGEYRAGAGRGAQSVVCVTLGTGVGCGIVLNGKILCGALGTAGEIGHIPVVRDGRPCNCGRRGCMETYASGTGIWNIAQESTVLAKHAQSAEDVFALAAQGHGEAQTIISQAVAYLGQVLVSAVNILSPDALIFSGGMCNQQSLFIEPLEAYIRTHAYALVADTRLKVSVAELGENAPMIGAALLER